MGNMPYLGNSIERSVITTVLKQLKERLPNTWKIQQASGSRRPQGLFFDGSARLTDPSGTAAELSIEAKTQLEPQTVARLTDRLRAESSGPVLVAAPFLSPRTRERLRDAGLNYADITGNVRLSLSKPALFIEARGADENPEPMTRERRS